MESRDDVYVSCRQKRKPLYKGVRKRVDKYLKPNVLDFTNV